MSEDPDVDVEMNDEALRAERDRRTVELEVQVDDVHATALDQLEATGIDVESVLAARIRPSVESQIHALLQQAKYRENHGR